MRLDEHRVAAFPEGARGRGDHPRVPRELCVEAFRSRIPLPRVLPGAGADQADRDVDVTIRLVRAGAWKNARKWDSTAKRLDAQFARDAGVIAATARAFRKRGYAVFVKPHD